MLKRNLAVKYLLVVLIMILVISPLYSFYPEHHELEMNLNASYVELEYGPDVDPTDQSFQFIAEMPCGSCSNLKWELEENEYLDISSTGFVRVKNNDKRLEGDMTLTVNCTNEHGCAHATAEIILLAPLVEGPPMMLKIPSNIKARAPLFNYSDDFYNDFIVPKNKLNIIKYFRER